MKKILGTTRAGDLAKWRARYQLLTSLFAFPRDLVVQSIHLCTYLKVNARDLVASEQRMARGYCDYADPEWSTGYICEFDKRIRHR